ncbi:MAG: TonB-dependent receptor [Candidatus Alcyoniella australis]|nr:TonB-dependent receptor [Candidatus Alcyoniella australis]
MRQRELILAAALWAVLLVCAPLRAEEDADEQPPGYTLPELVVSAEALNESVEDPPAFVQVIDAKSYAGRMATTEEMLSSAVGVHMRDFGGLGQLSTISIRGTSADQVVVLIDGVRVNPASGGGVDFSSIPAEHIQRIEVLRGGESALYGEGAVGGVVNIVTRKAGTGEANTLGVSYGSFDTLRLSAARSAQLKKWSYLASIGYLHSSGAFPFVSNNGTELDDSDDRRDVRRNNGFDSRGLLIKAGFAATKMLDVSVQNELVSSRRGMPGLVTFPTPHAYSEQLREMLTVKSALAEVLPGLTLTSGGSLIFADQSYGDQAGEGTGVAIDSHQRQYAPEVRQALQYVWGAHQIWLLSGQYRLDILRDEQFDDPQRTTWSAALRDQIMLWGELLTVVPAVRYDSASEAGDQWSPKLGMALKPLSWLTIKANAGRSFRAPNFYELYFNQGFVVGNPQLKPERAWSMDGGVQFNTRIFNAEAVYFRSEIDDLIEYLLLSGFRYKPFNIGRAIISGYEGRAALRPVDCLALSAAYTYTDAIDDTDEPNRRGNQIPGRPRHKAAGKVELLIEPCTLFAEYRFISGNYVTRANTKLLEPRQVLNAGLIVRAGEHFRIGAEVKNLSDDRMVDVRGLPLPGRSVFLTLQSSF